jgi:hypothetical protein
MQNGLSALIRALVGLIDDKAEGRKSRLTVPLSKIFLKIKNALQNICKHFLVVGVFIKNVFSMYV